MTGSKRTPRKRQERGFALLVAIVLSAVAAVITFELANIAYKNLLLASDATQSQYAFYAADSALECALLGDKGDVSFPYQSGGSPNGTTISCEGNTVTFNAKKYNSTTVEYYTTTVDLGWFSVNSDSNVTRCARLTVYKANDNSISVYAEGLNVSCSNTGDPRALERSEKAGYGPSSL